MGTGFGQLLPPSSSGYYWHDTLERHTSTSPYVTPSMPLCESRGRGGQVNFSVLSESWFPIPPCSLHHCGFVGLHCGFRQRGREMLGQSSICSQSPLPHGHPFAAWRGIREMCFLCKALIPSRGPTIQKRNTLLLPTPQTSLPTHRFAHMCSQSGLVLFFT